MRELHRTPEPWIAGKYEKPGPSKLWYTTPQLLRLALIRTTNGQSDRDYDLWEREQEAWWDGGAHDQCLAKDEGLAARYVERGLTCGGA